MMRLFYLFVSLGITASVAIAEEAKTAEDTKPTQETKNPAPNDNGKQTTNSFHKVHHQAEVMGTVVSLTIWTTDDAIAEKTAAEVFKEFRRVNKKMSSWLPDSDVARINAEAGQNAVTVDAEVFEVTNAAQAAAKQSRGAFDITVGAFRGLWKFDEDIDGSIPKDEDVKERSKLVGYRDVQLRAKAKTVRLKRKGMRITLGGVAKGYAVDRGVEILRKNGLNDFIIQAGGDLYASGTKSGTMWRVGIRDPRGARGARFASIPLKNATFSTSGDYERSLIVKGVRYNHILDPRTGYPATRSRSVTVKAPDALTADIWSTALFVMGVEKGMPLVEKRRDLEAVFVDAKNVVHVSSGLKGELVIERQPSSGI